MFLELKNYYFPLWFIFKSDLRMCVEETTKEIFLIKYFSS